MCDPLVPNTDQRVNAIQRIAFFYLDASGLGREHGLMSCPPGQPAVESGVAGVALDVLSLAEWYGDYCDLFNRMQGDHERAIRGVEDALRQSGEYLAKHPPVVDPNPPPPPTYTDGYGLIPQGRVLLRGTDGQPYFGLGCTAFPMLQIWIDRGEGGIAAWVDWMDRSGVTLARVFGSYNGAIGRFIPGEYGEKYFAGISTLLDYLYKRQKRLILDVLADMQNAPLDQVDRARLFSDVGNVCHGHTNIILGGGNQWPNNGWDPQALSKPSGVIASRGTANEDQLPPLNPWDCFEFDTPRNESWPKGAKAILDIQTGNTTEGVSLSVAGGVIEPIGLNSPGEPGWDPAHNNSGNTSDSAEDWADFVATGKMFGSYVILHTRSGIKGLQVPGPRSQACVDSARRAADAVPDDMILGSYTRGGLADCPIAHDDTLALRTYVKIRNGNRAVAVAIRPAGGWRAQAVNGWTITAVGGRGNIILLER